MSSMRLLQVSAEALKGTGSGENLSVCLPEGHILKKNQNVGRLSIRGTESWLQVDSDVALRQVEVQ